MQFCPICSNLLLVEDGGAGYRFCCQTCPYVSAITRKISKTMKLKRKEVDDVLGGEDAWAAANRTTAQCPFCDNNEVRALVLRRGGSVGFGFDACLAPAAWCRPRPRPASSPTPPTRTHAPHNPIQAFFVQMQIRSADEPMTTFYRCTHCANRWSGD